MMFNRKTVARDPEAGRFFGGYWDAPEVRQAVKTRQEGCNSGEGSAEAPTVLQLILELGETKLE
jgi:hypothetical protein